jgi:hypothetical protein
MDDFTTKAQLPLFDDSQDVLKVRLGQIFAGRDTQYEDLLNEAYPDPRFHMYIEKHFHPALQDMAKEAKVTKIPVTSKTTRGLRGRDRLLFPSLRESQGGLP